MHRIIRYFLLLSLVSWIAFPLPALLGVTNAKETLAAAMKYYHSENYEATLSCLERLHKQMPKEGEVLYWLGKVHFQLMKPKESSSYYEEALELGYENAATYFGLGQAYGAWAMDASLITQARLAGKIRRAFEEALDHDPDHFDANVALMMFYEQAPGFMGGSFDKAVQLGEHIRRLKPAEGSDVLAGLYLRKKKENLAVAVYEDLVRSNPSKPEYHVSLLALRLEAEQFEGWFDAYEVFESQFGKHGNALYQLGKFGALTGRQLEKAKAGLRYYLTLEPLPDNPSHADAYWRLGQVLEHSRRFDKASESYVAAINLDPENKRFQKSLKQLKKSGK